MSGPRGPLSPQHGVDEFITPSAVEAVVFDQVSLSAETEALHEGDRSCVCGVKAGEDPVQRDLFEPYADQGRDGFGGEAPTSPRRIEDVADLSLGGRSTGQFEQDFADQTAIVRQGHGEPEHVAVGNKLRVHGVRELRLQGVAFWRRGIEIAIDLLKPVVGRIGQEIGAFERPEDEAISRQGKQVQA